MRRLPVLLASLLELAALVPAQGAGPQAATCASFNPNGGSLQTTGTTPGHYVAMSVVAPTTMLVKGFEVWLKVEGAPSATIPTHLYLADANGLPTGLPIRTGTLTATNTAAFQTTTFAPIRMQAGQVFFIGYRSPTSLLLKDQLTSGRLGLLYEGLLQPPTSPVFRRSAWRVTCSELGLYAPYGYGCGGSGSGTGDYCVEANTNAISLSTTTLAASLLHVFRVVAPTDMTIDGFSFYARDAVAPSTVSTIVNLADGANGSPGTRVRAAGMHVGITPTWNRTCFEPLNLTAGQAFYIGLITTAASRLEMDCVGGVFGTYYSAVLGFPWIGPVSDGIRPGWRLHCSSAVALNPFATTTGTQSWVFPRRFAHQVTAPSDLWLDGFAFRCKDTSAVNIPSHVYRALPDGKPAPTPVRTSTMAVGTAMDWAETRFSRLFVASGETFFIGFETPSSTFRVDNGAVGATSTYFENIAGNWVGPGATRSSWRVNRAACTGRNDLARTTTGNTGTGFYAFGPFTASGLTTIDNFALFLSANTQVVASGHVWVASGGQPATDPVRTAPLQIGTASQWCRTSFEPLVLAPGTQYFVGLSTTNPFVHAVVSPGSPGPYFFKATAASTWSPSSDTVGVRVDCAEHGTPLLRNFGAPEVGTGTSFEVTLTGARPASAFGLSLGGSRTVWNGIGLPLNLGILGAPECHLFAAFDQVLASGSTGNGNVAIRVPVPSNASLVGQKFYNQFFLLDAGANAFNIVFSNAAEGTIGG